MHPKVNDFLNNVGIVRYADRIRITEMFLSDSEDWKYVQLYHRLIPITKTQYILKRWEQYTNYVKANKHLYFKYLINVKN
jgi:hypothetical protein